MYSIKEIYYSIQGEGAMAGRPAVFCRFAGCNLWSGRESDRASAICRFCDTDFVGGEKFANAAELADRVVDCWPNSPDPFVILTGGEPALQVDRELVSALGSRRCEIAIETNGSRPLPAGIHWVTVSPKSGVELMVTSGEELKLVFPQVGVDPRDFERLDFDHFYLQPMFGDAIGANTREAVRYCLDRPKWSLSLQIHKHLGLR